MTVAYILISSAALLFSLQFFFQRGYFKTEGHTVKSVIIFSFLTAVMKIVFVLAIYGFNLKITPFGVFIALLSSAVGMLNGYFSAKAFLAANMSVYSMFTMLGGMLLPFIAGVAFYGEGLTARKSISCLIILAALLLVTGKEDKKGKGAVKYYVGVFLSNGLYGVLSKVNQSSENGADSGGFLLLGGIWSVVLCGGFILWLMLVKKESLFENVKNALATSAVFGIITSAGNLFLLIALETLDASVQYPMITGGTIVFSTVTAAICKEKQGRRNIIGAALAVVSAVLIAL